MPAPLEGAVLTAPTRPGWANELHVAPTSTSPAQARAFVESYCSQQDLPYLVDDIRLVVTELVTNAVLHARTRIRVTIENVPSGVLLTVYDECADLPLMSLAGSMLAEGENGRGLWLVDACSADWGTDAAGDEGKSTWATFAVRPNDQRSCDEKRIPTGG